jgi:hypothetical protein
MIATCRQRGCVFPFILTNRSSTRCLYAWGMQQGVRIWVDIELAPWIVQCPEGEYPDISKLDHQLYMT